VYRSHTDTSPIELQELCQPLLKTLQPCQAAKLRSFAHRCGFLAASPAHYAAAAVSSLAPDTGTRLISNRKGISLA
jgi:hypothetical protein